MSASEPHEPTPSSIKDDLARIASQAELEPASRAAPRPKQPTTGHMLKRLVLSMLAALPMNEQGATRERHAHRFLSASELWNALLIIFVAVLAVMAVCCFGYRGIMLAAGLSVCVANRLGLFTSLRRSQSVRSIAFYVVCAFAVSFVLPAATGNEGGRYSIYPGFYAAWMAAICSVISDQQHASGADWLLALGARILIFVLPTLGNLALLVYLLMVKGIARNEYRFYCYVLLAAAAGVWLTPIAFASDSNWHWEIGYYLWAASFVAAAVFVPLSRGMLATVGGLSLISITVSLIASALSRH